MKKLRILVSTTTAALVAGAFIASPALAHTSVYDSNPQDGAAVDAAPEEVWVQFGNPMLPAPQPLAINGGQLEVFDACGEKVSQGETEMNDEQSQLTSASGGNTAGRYELIWTAEASDGAVQSGLIDFNVSAGNDCDYVLRRDTLKDIDHGFDIKSVKATQTLAGATKTQTKLKKPITCKSLATKSDDGLQLVFDTNADEEIDFVASFGCKNDKFKATVTEAGDDIVLATYRATLAPKGNVLTTRVKASDFSDGEHFDIAAESVSEADECSEEPAEGEEAPACVDRAPDLGVLRLF
jgi:methionine-rich copper-binding protein CopC